MSEKSDIGIIMHPAIWEQIRWMADNLKAYRKAGYPLGKSRRGLKRWIKYYRAGN